MLILEDDAVVKDDFFPRLRFLLALIEEQQQQQR
jgi:GR25 family glycosyltransferase involved in LPS biosynthesis